MYGITIFLQKQTFFTIGVLKYFVKLTGEDLLRSSFLRELPKKRSILTHLFPMHPFSTPLKTSESPTVL